MLGVVVVESSPSPKRTVRANNPGGHTSGRPRSNPPTICNNVVASNDVTCDTSLPAGDTGIRAHFWEEEPSDPSDNTATNPHFGSTAKPDRPGSNRSTKGGGTTAGGGTTGLTTGNPDKLFTDFVVVCEEETDDAVGTWNWNGGGDGTVSGIVTVDSGGEVVVVSSWSLASSSNHPTSFFLSSLVVIVVVVVVVVVAVAVLPRSLRP